MTQDIAKSGDAMKDFQQKVMDKIREDIGKLLPEEVVQALFQKALDQEFFTPRTVKSDSYGRTEQKPSWFAEAIAKEATTLLQAETTAFFEKNKPLIQEQIKKFLEQQNLLIMTMTCLTHHTREDLRNGLQSLANGMRSF